jgi:hypothetical protein
MGVNILNCEPIVKVFTSCEMQSCCISHPNIGWNIVEVWQLTIGTSWFQLTKISIHSFQFMSIFVVDFPKIVYEAYLFVLVLILCNV